MILKIILIFQRKYKDAILRRISTLIKEFHAVTVVFLFVNVCHQGKPLYYELVIVGRRWMAMWILDWISPECT